MAVELDLSGLDDEPPASTEAGCTSEPGPTGELEPAGDFIVSPIDGRVVELGDVDGLIDVLETLNTIDSQIYAAKVRIRETLARMTDGDAKTRRIQGKRRKAKIEMPDDRWNQGILKEAFNAYPQHAKTYLRISSISVQLREFKKLVNTTGTPDLNQFRDMLTQANEGPSGTPTVKIEQ